MAIFQRNDFKAFKSDARKHLRAAISKRFASLISLLLICGTLIIPASSSSANSVLFTVTPPTDNYLMAYLYCPSTASTCNDPRYHMVQLAQSNDGVTWTNVQGWVPQNGSVPDVIRRGNTIYVYAVSMGQGAVLWKIDVATGKVGQFKASLSDGSSFVDPSLSQLPDGRLVLFYTPGNMNGLPGQCATGQSSCTVTLNEAIESPGTDGGVFIPQPTPAISVNITSSSAPPVTDPNLFYNGSQWVVYVSRGNDIDAYTSSSITGPFSLSKSSITHNSGGVPSAIYDANSKQVWTYSQTSNSSGDLVIQRSVSSDGLSPSGFATVITKASVTYESAQNVQSPGTALNTMGLSCTTACASSGNSGSSSSTTTSTTLASTGSASAWQISNDAPLSATGVSPFVIHQSDGSDQIWVTSLGGQTVYVCKSASCDQGKAVSGWGNDFAEVTLQNGTKRAYFTFGTSDVSTPIQIMTASVGADGFSEIQPATATGLHSATGQARGAFGVPNAIVLPNGLVRIYYVNYTGTNANPSGTSSQCLGGPTALYSATSTDTSGTTFTVDAGVRVAGSIGDPQILSDQSGNWLMIAASGPTCTQQLYLLTSEDGLDWNIVSTPLTGTDVNRFDPTGYQNGDGTYTLIYATRATSNGSAGFLHEAILKKSVSTTTTTMPPTTTTTIKKVVLLTINCYKGKLLKKVTAVKPVCPAGYVKK